LKRINKKRKNRTHDIRWLPVLCLAFFFLETGCGLLNQHDLLSLEQDIFHLINGHRKSLGLGELVWNDLIAQVCREHSKEMASGASSFSHDGFDDRTGVIGRTIPYAQISEIIGYVVDVWGISSPTERVFQTWLTSASHLGAIEGDFELTGVGAARSGTTYYFSQIFLRKSH